MYVSTLQMAVSKRSDSVASFCKECVLWRVFGFHLTAPYILHGCDTWVSYLEKGADVKDVRE